MRRTKLDFTAAYRVRVYLCVNPLDAGIMCTTLGIYYELKLTAFVVQTKLMSFDKGLILSEPC